MIDFVTIPKERMKILRNDRSAVEKLEKLSDSKIELNEEVSIECEDSLKLLRVKEVVKAFGRGFDLEATLDLLDEEYSLHLVEIKDFAGKSRNRIVTLKGRVIGTGGKTKKLIENFAEVKISIYGKTIAIIGKWDRVMIAKKAIEMILLGSLHSTVYRFLEKQRR